MPEKLNTNSETLEKPASFGEILETIDSTNIEVYKQLNNTNKVAKEEFLTNPEMIKPNIEYGNLQPETILDNLSTLIGLKNGMAEMDISSQEKHLATILMDDAFNKNDFVAANISYNLAKTPEEKAEIAPLHKEANERLYGKPDEATFYSLLKDDLTKIKVDSLSAEDKKEYDQLLKEIGPIPEEKTERFKPKQETIDRFSDMVSTLFEGFFKHIPEGKDEFTTREACAIANEIIVEEIGEDATEYRAVMDSDISNCSVSHDKRSVKFPVERAAGNFSRKDLEKILAHELGTHAFRAINYENSDVYALSHAMPGNEEIDEGIAKCCEQAIDRKYEDAGIEHYLNIGFANFKDKNFREIYEINQKLLHLQEINPDNSPEDVAAIKKRQNKCFNDVVRCFRGTAELPNNKDLVYYNGANKVWQYIEKNIDDPNLMDSLFLSGKSNILDKSQQQFVYETKVS